MTGNYNTSLFPFMEVAMIINSLLGQIKKAQKTRKLIQELRQLDDRELNDMDLSRYDIPEVAKGKYRPEFCR